MRSVVCAVVLCLCAGAAGNAEGAGKNVRRGHPWLRRITWAAACAASFWDAQTTRAAVRYGAVETNGLFAGPQGHPRWGLLFGTKAAICAGTGVLEEIAGPRTRADGIWTTGNAGMAAGFGIAAWHNRALAGHLARAPGK